MHVELHIINQRFHAMSLLCVLSTLDLLGRTKYLAKCTPSARPILQEPCGLNSYQLKRCFVLIICCTNFNIACAIYASKRLHVRNVSYLRC